MSSHAQSAATALPLPPIMPRDHWLWGNLATFRADPLLHLRDDIQMQVVARQAE